MEPSALVGGSGGQTPGKEAPLRPAPAPDAVPIREIIAFDFDGTLTVRDSFTAFLLRRTRGRSRLAASVRLAPAALAYLTHRDRGRLKVAVITALLKGVSRQALRDEAQAFAAQAVPGLLRPDALAAWERHRRSGARLVIVTASPEILVAPFAHALRADQLIGTRLEFDRADRVTGRLVGANCRGGEKTARLRGAFGPDVRLAVAYGDTAGDREMLALADRPFLRLFQARPATLAKP